MVYLSIIITAIAFNRLKQVCPAVLVTRGPGAMQISAFLP